MGPYDVGQAVKLTVKIATSSGAPQDPGTVTCEVLPHGASESQTLSVSRLQAGEYQATLVTTNAPGYWAYRFETTDPIGAVEQQFQVNSTQFPGG